MSNHAPAMLHVLRSAGFSEVATPALRHEFLREDGRTVGVISWGLAYRVRVTHPNADEVQIRLVDVAELAYWLGTDGHRESRMVLPGVPA